jgi:hypothetical protein
MDLSNENFQMLDEDILDINLLITSIEEMSLLWDKTVDITRTETKEGYAGETYLVK